MGCSCQGGDPSAMETTIEIPAKMQETGLRRVTEMAGEPLLAVYEDDASESPTVFGCGTPTCDPLTTGQPVALRIEKFKAGALVQGDEFELPKDLQANYGGANRVGTPNCLPWVRISRDPERFSSCLAAARKLGRMDSAKKVHTLFKRHAAKEDQEVFYVLLLDVHLYVRGVGEISRGARDRVQTPIPDILRLPIIEGATTFIVVHNHPSGNVKPSEADKQITKAIAQAAAKVEVPLFDHVIVGADKYFSFYEHKLL
jgi:hypothetical protein